MSMRQLASARLPTTWGDFILHGFSCTASGAEVAVLTRGMPEQGWQGHASPLLCRVHSACLTGDAFGSLRCDCGPQLQRALQEIAAEGAGLLIYLPQEGRGIGLVNKIRAYAQQDQGLDTVDANLHLGLQVDARDYSMASDILKVLGVRRLRLLTNNPDKVLALQQAGLEVVERVPLQVEVQPQGRSYLMTKWRRLGHLLDLPEDGGREHGH